MELFVTYSWINNKPDENVLKLVDALRENGYNAVCDILLKQQETAINFNKMMAEGLQANKVIVVLSEKYKEKADSFKDGVGAEYQYILEDIKNKTQKYILVTFENDRDKVTPEFLRGREILLLDKTNIIVDALLYKINEIPHYDFPPVKPEKTLPISQKIDTLGQHIEEKGTFPVVNYPYAENPYFTGRTEILDLIYDNFQNGDNVARVQLLRGIGGVGKSSIALHYAYTHQDEYDFVWWVNAESSDTVLFSYKKFLLELEIITEEDEAAVVIRAMELWFMRNKKWLFIYDNADAADIAGSWLERYLPKKRNGHILITTRSWDSYIGEMIDITVFTETEAVSFLKMRVRMQGSGYSVDSAKELAELLQYFPLALEQAAAYIRETPGVIYRDYINLFNEYGIEIFDAGNQLMGYDSTITVTWKISMDKITNESAKQMFNMCAYLAPDTIPVEMFIRGSKILPKPLQSGISDHLQRDAILADMVRYSLLSYKRDESVPGDEKRLLSMQRFLQEVVQKNFGSETAWLERGYELMCVIVDWDTENKSSMDAFKIESPHAVAIAEKTYKVFKDDSAKMMNAAVFFFSTARIYRKLSFLELALSHCAKCIDILERYCMEDEPEKTKNYLLLAYLNRGQNYTAMTAYDKAIEDYDKSIAIGEQLRVEDKLYLHFANALAMAYMDRGNTYEYMKLHDKALLDKNKSIEMYERLYKAGIHRDENGLALAYVNRGVTYRSMDKYNEAMSDYNRSIEIWEKLKIEGKVINEAGLADAYLNKGIASSKLALEENKERLSNDGEAIYTHNTSKACLNYQKKQTKIMEGKQMEEFKKDFENINKAIQAFENMRQTGKLFDENEFAAAYTRRGMFYFQINMFDKAILDFNQCIEIMERLLNEKKSPNANELAKVYSDRGMAYYVTGKCDRALPDITKSIDIWERLQIQGQFIEESMLFNMYIIRGGVLNTMADYMDDAISDYRKSIEIAERLKIAGKPLDEDRLASAHMGIAQSLDQKEEFAEANEYYDQCIGIWERLLSKGQPLSDEENLAIAYMNRGLNYYLLKENDKALSDHDKCISIRERLKSQGVQQDPYLVSVSYGNRADAYKVANNTTAAIKDYISAVHVLKEVFSELPELQELYYDMLARLINLFGGENDNTLYDDVLQEFLYSMCSVSKTEEAEEAQNNILEQLGRPR